MSKRFGKEAEVEVEQVVSATPVEQSTEVDTAIDMDKVKETLDADSKTSSDRPKRGRVSVSIVDPEDDFPMRANARVPRTIKVGAKAKLVITIEMLNAIAEQLGITVGLTTVDRGLHVIDIALNKIEQPFERAITERLILNSVFHTINYAYADENKQRLMELEGKGLGTTAEYFAGKLGIIPVEFIGAEEQPTEVHDKVVKFKDLLAGYKKLAIDEMKAGKFTRVVKSTSEEAPQA